VNHTFGTVRITHDATGVAADVRVSYNPDPEYCSGLYRDSAVIVISTGACITQVYADALQLRVLAAFLTEAADTIEEVRHGEDQARRHRLSS
jgi:hypothetical protein